HVFVAEVQGQRVPVDRAVEVWMAAQRVDGGSDHDVAAAQTAIEQRLLADAVTGQHQPALPAVPDREGEHAVDLFQSGLDAPLVEGLYQDLGVGMTSEPNP